MGMWRCGDCGAGGPWGGVGGWRWRGSGDWPPPPARLLVLEARRSRGRVLARLRNYRQVSPPILSALR